MRGAPRTVDLPAERARLQHELAAIDRVLREARYDWERVGVQALERAEALAVHYRKPIRRRLRALRRIERHRARTDAKRVSAAMAKELAAE